VKKFVFLLAVAAVLVFSSIALAGGGTGGGRLAAHLARVDARVAKYEQACKVASPAAKCADRKARLTARLTAFENRLDAKIAKGGDAARIVKLTSARDHVAQLLASL